MLFTEPEVQAVPLPLGRFESYAAQEHADLRYGGQIERMRALIQKAPEERPPEVIPAPPTPTSR